MAVVQFQRLCQLKEIPFSRNVSLQPVSTICLSKSELWLEQLEIDTQHVDTGQSLSPHHLEHQSV